MLEPLRSGRIAGSLAMKPEDKNNAEICRARIITKVLSSPILAMFSTTLTDYNLTTYLYIVMCCDIM
jgi:hypothetical protein